MSQGTWCLSYSRLLKGVPVALSHKDSLHWAAHVAFTVFTLICCSGLIYDRNRVALGFSLWLAYSFFPCEVQINIFWGKKCFGKSFEGTAGVGAENPELSPCGGWWGAVLTCDILG